MIPNPKLVMGLVASNCYSTSSSSLDFVLAKVHGDRMTQAQITPRLCVGVPRIPVGCRWLMTIVVLSFVLVDSRGKEIVVSV